MVLLDQRDLRGRRDLQEQWGLPVQPDLQDHQGQRDLRGLLDRQEQLDQRGLWGLPDRPAWIRPGL